MRRRLHAALGVDGQEQLTDTQLQFISNGLELRLIELLENGQPDEVRTAAVEAFQAARVLPRPPLAIQAGEALIHLACLGVLGDRGADVRRISARIGDARSTPQRS